MPRYWLWLLLTASCVTVMMMLQLLHDPVTLEWITDLYDILNLLAMMLVLQPPFVLFGNGGCCQRWLRLPVCPPACC